MANKEHLEILMQGVEAWNRWRYRNKIYWHGIPDLKESNLEGLNLEGADLSSAYLDEANLTGANLTGANLVGSRFKGAKLQGANLSDTDLRETRDLKKADLRGVNLSRANLSQVDLCDANLSNAIVENAEFWHTELRKANFQGANLSGADLRGANLNTANFREANLSKAILFTTQALATDFRSSIFTGACLEDWHINSYTNLDEVICDYVYLKFAPYPGHSERRPHIGFFAPGDFIKLVQDSLDTVDLIFKEGVNWKAFTCSFHNTQVENEGTPLAIRSIENKGDGVVLIRVAVPPNADKIKIHEDFKQGYKFAQKALEAQYQKRLEDKDKHLEDKDKHINQLFKLLHQAQEKSGEVQKIMAEKPGIQQNFHGNIGNAAGNVEGDQKTIQHNYAPEQKQTLAKAAAEIQQLLKQLEATYPTATEEEKETVLAIKVEQEIKRNPTFKARLRNALKEGGIEALKVLFAPVGIPIEMVRGWIEAEAE